MLPHIVVIPEQLEITTDQKLCSISIRNSFDKYTLIKVTSPLTSNIIIKPNYYSIPPRKEKPLTFNLLSLSEVDATKQYKITIEYMHVLKPMEEREVKEMLTKTEKKEKKVIPITIFKAHTSKTEIETKFKSFAGIEKSVSSTNSLLQEDSVKDTEIKMLRNDNEKLKLYSSTKLNEYDKLVDQYQRVMSENTKLSNTISSMEVQISQNEKKEITQMDPYNSEVEALNSKLKLKETELQTMQAHSKSMEIRYEEQIKQLNNEICMKSLQIENYNKSQIKNQSAREDKRQHILSSTPICGIINPHKRENRTIVMANITPHITTFKINASDIKSMQLPNFNKKVDDLTSFYEEKCSQLQDEINICKEEFQSLIEKSIQHESDKLVQKQLVNEYQQKLKEAQHSIEGKEQEIRILVSTNGTLVSQLNKEIKNSMAIGEQMREATVKQLSMCLTSVKDILSKPTSKLNEIEKEIVTYECKVNLKEEHEVYKKALQICTKFLDFIKYMKSTFQSKTNKVTEILKNIALLDSTSMSETNQAKQKIIEILPLVQWLCLSSAELKQILLKYVEHKKAREVSAQKQITYIDTISEQIANMSSQFQKSVECISQQLQSHASYV